ncbi:MAG: TIGR00645 family protein [Alphaproteobacteria bacterium]|nr:TIGR00645 family protein [Alphaproteobacteria bacterium]
MSEAPSQHGLEKVVERIIFASRWLQAPLYLGLVVVLLLVVVKFLAELVHLSAILFSADESRMVLYVLTLVDLVMVANLTVMVIISGYENFVSRIENVDSADQLSWFGKLDAGSLKIKLASSIVAISSIHLLKAFLDAGTIANDKLLILVAIHLTFVVSAILLAYLDKLAFGGHAKGGKGH